MMGFKNYTNVKEGKFPTWLKMFVGVLVMRLKNLQNQIKSQTDPKIQNNLIGKQNTILGMVSGLGIGINSKDKEILQKMKSISKGK